MRSHLAIISLGASFQIQMWELGNTGWCNILKNPPGGKKHLQNKHIKWIVFKNLNQNVKAKRAIQDHESKIILHYHFRSVSLFWNCSNYLQEYIPYMKPESYNYFVYLGFKKKDITFMIAFDLVKVIKL